VKLLAWPPTAEDLIPRLPLEETALVEFKRAWHDLESGRGKAEFVKDILALANSALRDEPAYLVVGVSDSKEGRQIVGVDQSPSMEQLHQILTAYTNPVPQLEFARVSSEGRHLDVVRLSWSESQLFYSIRDHEGILDTRLVYVRRGPTVGTLRPAELETVLRAKGDDAAAAREHPIHVGFVEDGQEHGRIVLRIANLSERPIEGLSVLWDIEHPRGAFFHRWRSIRNLHLGPGESREDGYEPLRAPIMVDGAPLASSTAVAHRWMQVTARLQYRDRRGFIREIERSLAVEL
jgi:hypothetical protein